MITYSQARIHAASCGFDLVSTDAVPIDKIISRSKSGKGAWTAIDILHPVSQETIYPAGYWLDFEDIPKLKNMGIDYVILED